MSNRNPEAVRGLLTGFALSFFDVNGDEWRSWDPKSVHRASLLGSVRRVGNRDNTSGIGNQLSGRDVPLPATSLQHNIYGPIGPRTDEMNLEASPSVAAVVVDVAYPIQTRMLDATHCVLNDRVVLGEIQGDGGRSTAAQIQLATHGHHQKDDEQTLKSPPRFLRDADGSQHF